MHKHFTEPEMVELGCFIALTMGQQSWLRLLNIEHHEVMAGDRRSAGPGQSIAGLLGEKNSGEERRRLMLDFVTNDQ